VWLIKLFYQRAEPNRTAMFDEKCAPQDLFGIHVVPPSSEVAFNALLIAR
jgi:hypothetical protein